MNYLRAPSPRNMTARKTCVALRHPRMLACWLFPSGKKFKRERERARKSKKKNNKDNCLVKLYIDLEECRPAGKSGDHPHHPRCLRSSSCSHCLVESIFNPVTIMNTRTTIVIIIIQRIEHSSKVSPSSSAAAAAGCSRNSDNSRVCVIGGIRLAARPVHFRVHVTIRGTDVWTTMNCSET